jgi:hypothetical protein
MGRAARRRVVTGWERHRGRIRKAGAMGEVGAARPVSRQRAFRHGYSACCSSRIPQRCPRLAVVATALSGTGQRRARQLAHHRQQGERCLILSRFHHVVGTCSVPRRVSKTFPGGLADRANKLRQTQNSPTRVGVLLLQLSGARAHRYGLDRSTPARETASNRRHSRPRPALGQS